MKNFFLQIWENPVFVPALIAWLIAQVLKTLINWRMNRHLSWERMVGSGGMPSSHSALVVCATIMLGLTQGFNSPLTGGMAIVSLIVMYDASGVRKETGKQAKVINDLMERLFSAEEIDEALLKELIGHEPIEVFAGAILGVLVAIGCYFEMYHG